MSVFDGHQMGVVRVPLGTRVVFTRQHEEPHPRFEDVTRVVTDDVVAVDVREKEWASGRQDGVLAQFRSAEVVVLGAQEWVHPEDGEAV